VAILGTVDRADPIHTFRGVWLFTVIASGLGALVAASMGTVRQHAPAPAGELALQQT
jgi:hypothetical protein